ncbi:oligosaccharide flippase family protein [Aliivibrio fischeri]|uniref:oligosaccharide flippase family protein n=1 Tax=Aliivibrio fischeri TaxID=668 RepID=UPI0012DAA6E9|nr:oligosaccharide flippase family protein [Aliivibrio fischeri]
MKSFFKNISFMWISALCSAVLAFLFQVLLARTLEPRLLGEFNSTLSFILIFGALSGFGVDNTILKIFAKSISYGNSYGKSIGLYIISSSIFSLILLMSFSFFINGIVIDNIFILSPLIFSLGFFNLQSAVYQIEAKYNKLALWQIANSLIRLLVIIPLLFDLLERDKIYYLYSLSSILIVVFSIPSMLKLLNGMINHKEDKEDKGIIYILKQSFPFGIGGLAHTLYFQSNIYLLSHLYSNESAAYYSVSFSILLAVYLFPAVVFQKVLLPRIHEWSYRDIDKLVRVFQYGNGFMILSGVFFSIFIYFLSPTVITIFFGDEYLESIYILKLLTFVIPIRFLISSCGSILSTRNLVNYKVIMMSLVAVLNFILSYLLIPEYGIDGAVVMLILSELLLCILFLFVIYKKMFGIRTMKNWFEIKVFK